MNLRPSVRLLVPLLATALALAACGADDEPGSVATTAPGTTTAPPSPPVTLVTTTLATPGKVACDALEVITTDITSRFPDSVGIEAGAVLNEEQIAAVRDLATEFAEVDVPDEGVAALRDTVITAAEAVLARADAGEPLTATEATGLTGALRELGSLCSVGG